MVGSSSIDIHTLLLDELVGVVNLYPWYGAARVELCRRMAGMGEGWGEEQYAAEALYVPDRGKISSLLRKGRSADCSDKDLQQLLKHLRGEEEIPPALGTLLAIRHSKPHGRVKPLFFMQERIPFKKFA